jgi:UDP-N-acetylglucosamine 3-dehydrogenase
MSAKKSISFSKREVRRCGELKRTNVAVIGAGYWGKKIVYEYSQLAKENSEVKLFAVCDLAKENLLLCSNDYGVSYVCSSLEDILSSPEIDAVNICTPSETHFKISKAALEAGKHILVEKPMSLTSSEAYELYDLAKAKDLVISVGHIYRFNNALKKVRNLIKDGYFGDIYYLKLQWTTLCPSPEGRDILTDLAPHPFDIINYLLHEWPSKILCKAKTYRRKELEEVAYCIAELGNGVMAHIELSWLLPGKIREVKVMGSKRCAKIDCLRQVIKVVEDGESYDLPVDVNNTIKDELEHFIACIGNGKSGKPKCENRNGGLLGANVVRLLEIARRSIKTERTETVEFR